MIMFISSQYFNSILVTDIAYKKDEYLPLININDKLGHFEISKNKVF
ncbi:hypothetical protein E24_00070 [Faustovirus]|nr:hypothetical protein E24_00070 [Faustovirus]